MNDPELEALWKRVLDGWEQDRAHGAFLEHCQQSGQLAEAAARYRGMVGDRQRGELAKKRLEGVAVLAIAALEASRTPSSGGRRQTGAWLLVLFFVAASIALLAYLGLGR
jgi:hypothetical protein